MAQMMSTVTSAGMWKCDEKREPPCKTRNTRGSLSALIHCAGL